MRPDSTERAVLLLLFYICLITILRLMSGILSSLSPRIAIFAAQDFVPLLLSLT